MTAFAFLWLLAVGTTASYFNPILPGFHPDPSCIYVEDTFFCVTSTFTWFPGVPFYASKDLRHWELISSVLNRREQLPQFADAPTGQDGLFASTIRHHNGTFYVTTTYVSIASYKDFVMENLIFSTKNPYNASSWSIPTSVNFTGYDPSLLFDDDGTVYFTGAAALSTGTAIALANIDVDTGSLGPITYPWNGTGLGTTEGPHVYKKNGWYYILVAEGGTQEKHRGSIARSRTVGGPYESNPANPIVIAEHLNSSYFQTVGHVDLFQDEETGLWWGVALAMRSGPDFVSYPMGRETVLFPVSWTDEAGGWPSLLEPVRGQMDASLPGQSGNASSIPGTGEEPDVVDLGIGSELPAHWLHIRYPESVAYVISPPGHPNELRLGLSARNLSSIVTSNSTMPKTTTFLGRRQTDTLFEFSVDIKFHPKRPAHEVGVSVYLDEKRHIDFAIISGDEAAEGKHLRLRSFSNNENVTLPNDAMVPLAGNLGADAAVRLQVRAENTTHYTFLVGQVGSGGQEGDVDMTFVGHSLASFVSGGYTGTVVGVYGTTNGELTGDTPVAYVSRLRYYGKGQYVDHNVFL
ncbi:xylosidase arabinofuranosidase [Colletotrichum karsti]|uniref:Xylosidase arabinofuranosidase n=1 Tax=Colletotrichum karsti TaxID=1095194 RepID=A0A9P6LCL6_9PEZI|nr:xylosidase arabinofuranosidase [Colletotrichum karsti]KAF9869189.1 xylosidase arabinofuranosidase [Colletotrichum karsti]